MTRSEGFVHHLGRVRAYSRIFKVGGCKRHLVWFRRGRSRQNGAGSSLTEASPRRAGYLHYRRQQFWQQSRQQSSTLLTLSLGSRGLSHVVINNASSCSRLRVSQFKLLCAEPLLVRGAGAGSFLRASFVLPLLPLLPLCSPCSLGALPCSLGALPCSPCALPCSLGGPSKAALLPFPNQNSNSQS